MEEFKIKDHSRLPRYLYRVIYAGSRTVSWPFYGLVAESFEPVVKSEHLAISTVHNLKWAQRDKIPLINLFPTHLRAAEWAKNRLEKKDSNTLILTIDTTKLEKTVVFKISEVVKGLFLEKKIDKAGQRDSDDGYMCLHQIPAAAIVTCEKIHPSIDYEPVQSRLRVLPAKLNEDLRDNGQDPPPSLVETSIDAMMDSIDDTGTPLLHSILCPLASLGDFDLLAGYVDTMLDDKTMLAALQADDQQWLKYCDPGAFEALKENHDDHPHLMMAARCMLLCHFARYQQETFNVAISRTGIECGAVWSTISVRFERIGGVKTVNWDALQSQLQVNMEAEWVNAMDAGEVESLKRLTGWKGIEDSAVVLGTAAGIEDKIGREGEGSEDSHAPPGSYYISGDAMFTDNPEGSDEIEDGDDEEIEDEMEGEGLFVE